MVSEKQRITKKELKKEKNDILNLIYKCIKK